MNACIYYHPEAYTTSQEKLMGRNSAGESFLKGFVKYSHSTEFWAQLQNNNHEKYFENEIRKNGRSEPIHFVNNVNIGDLTRPSMLFLPGPGISKHAYHRGAHGQSGWSLCGITHTTSSAGAMDSIAELVTSPVQPWDAVICTSDAVKNNVMKLLQAQVDYLKDRLGITKITIPQLPVIPLGIHTSDFSFSPTQKSDARNQLQIHQDEFAVLYMGRLSFHAKAHPLALYQALESASKQTNQKIVLIECGWFANEYIEKAFIDAAKTACPSVRIIRLDGRISANRMAAWAAANSFSSLADNIQETFGITPVEAMAAGLPVVVSDWDGYRDTVRDGIDGFRIPTIMPESGFGAELAWRHALEIDSYDIYCGYTCSLIAVDIQSATQAFVKLIESPDLCIKMGRNGQSYARDVFDWSVIIPRYESLWSELNKIRKEMSGTINSVENVWPARLDPFYSFGSYPTQQLSTHHHVELSMQDSSLIMEFISNVRSLKMIDFANRLIPNNDEVRMIVEVMSAGKIRVFDLISIFPQNRQAFILRSLPWFIKIGVIKYPTA